MRNGILNVHLDKFQNLAIENLYMKKKIIMLGGILFFTVLNAQLGIGLCSATKSLQLLALKKNNERLVSGTLKNSLSINSIPNKSAGATTIKTSTTVDFPTIKYRHYIHTSSFHIVHEVEITSPVFMSSLDAKI